MLAAQKDFVLRCWWKHLLNPQFSNVERMLVCDSDLRANEGRKTTCKMYWSPGQDEGQGGAHLRGVECQGHSANLSPFRQMLETNRPVLLQFDRCASMMCTVQLTQVYSPALFNERSMQLGLNTVWLQTLRRAGVVRPNHGVASNCKTESPDSKSTKLQKRNDGSSIPLVSREKKGKSQHDLISFLCATVWNRCITSSSNIHRTRHLGMNFVFESSLRSQVLSGVVTNHPDMAQALEQWR